MLAMVLAAITVLAVGIGITVGRESSSPISIVHDGTSTITASLPPTPSIHGIADDSSFAAVTTMEGVRHVIFQDVGGRLRQATQNPSLPDIWGSTENQWFAEDAKRRTPLAAFIRRTSGLNRVSDGIIMHLLPSPKFRANSAGPDHI